MQLRKRRKMLGDDLANDDMKTAAENDNAVLQLKCFQYRYIDFKVRSSKPLQRTVSSFYSAVEYYFACSGALGIIPQD